MEKILTEKKLLGNHLVLGAKNLTTQNELNEKVNHNCIDINEFLVSQ